LGMVINGVKTSTDPAYGYYYSRPRTQNVWGRYFSSKTAI
jgi:hypothetical protein